MRVRVSSIILLVAVLTAAQLSFAACVPSTRSLIVPAIVNDNRSEMVQISIETRPGTGEIYTSISPAVGYETQSSEAVASEIAFNIFGKRECDVFLRINASRGVNHVDGPSAGAAMTVMLLSALNGVELRKDFSMTGTIEPDGSIGMVGGIPLKAEAVAKLGTPIFLTPELPSYEKIGVSLVKKRYNIAVIEVDNVANAFNTVSSTEPPQERMVLKPDSQIAYADVEIGHWYSNKLKGTAGMMIESSKRKITSDTLTNANFESRLLNAESALKAKQFYTAANIAFLLSIDEDFANLSPRSVEEDHSGAKQCLSEFELKDLSLQNFEVVGPAQMRYVWASLRLPKEVPKENGFVASVFDGYYDTLYAKYWCIAATEMNNYRYEGSETYFDSGLLKSYTEGRLDNISAEAPPMGENSDLDFHLSAAEEEFSKGLYAASLVDLAYVKAYSDIGNVTNGQLDEVLKEKTSATYQYLWPQALKNHASSLVDTDKASALRIAFFASNINESFTEVSRIVSEKMKPVPQPLPLKEKEAIDIGAMILLGAVALVGAVIIILLVSERMNESKEEKKTKRTR